MILFVRVLCALQKEIVTCLFKMLCLRYVHQIYFKCHHRFYVFCFLLICIHFNHLLTVRSDFKFRIVSVFLFLLVYFPFSPSCILMQCYLVQMYSCSQIFLWFETQVLSSSSCLMPSTSEINLILKSQPLIFTYICLVCLFDFLFFNLSK